MKKAIALVAALTLLATLSTGLAFAHGHRDVGEYSFTVGFIVEPAYEGIKNGLDLRVGRHAEAAAGEEHVEGAVEEKKVTTPVEGLENTLQVEISYVDTGVSMTKPIRALFRDPGHYTADLIPTKAGSYRFRIFGTIEGVAVDETFTSVVDGFNAVASSADLQFPEKLPETRELESAVRGVQATAQDALATAQQAQTAAAGSGSDSSGTLAATGLVLGIVGTVFGLAGVAMAMRKRG
ncbi:MAG: hypothetical protein FJ312_03260 [SAR202 cluster bacterium]|nr:hypothetical protein [SAR202 cluster bacterium]